MQSSSAALKFVSASVHCLWNSCVLDDIKVMHMENWNHNLFLLINAGSEPSPAALLFATFLAQWLIYGVPVLLVFLWVKGGHMERKAAVSAALTVGVALVIGQMIIGVWPHPRPFMIGLGHQLLEHKAESSFPSDHATVFFALGFGLMLAGLRQLGGSVLLAGILVGWARVFLGVHFPLDIIGAGLLALPTAWLLMKFLQYHQHGTRLVNVLERMYARICRLPLKR